jgi:spore coat polysaccharide biosynthesis predicted glycosyltransferase SpsG
MNYKYIFYADGNHGTGMGHLFRSKNLVNNLNIKNESIFLYRNDFQKKFYIENDLKNNQIIDYKSHGDGSYYFFDTKKNFTQEIDFLNAPKSNSISIDNFTNARNYCKYEVYPSFYFEDKISITPDKNIYSGYKFSILNQKLIQSNLMRKTRDKITISFGGEDPNNLTLKVLSSIEDKEVLDRLLVILGPKYNFPIDLLTKFISEKQITKNPSNVYSIFTRSICVITALGVTLQELLRLNTPIILVNNYDEDLIDIKRIKNFCEASMNKNYFFHVGSYKKLDELLLSNSLYQSRKYDFKSKFKFQEMGASWNLSKML